MKAIVQTYMSPEHCDHPEEGCLVAALASELARAENPMRAQIFEKLATYKGRILPFMPGRTTTDKDRAFFAIFSTMIGAIELARLLPEPARYKVLQNAREFLLASFR